MVCEHDARGFAPEWLSETFSTAAFGNSVVAITAGMVAQSAADSVKLAPTSEGSSIMYGGFCMPFDLAIIVLIIGGSVLYSTWAENYGSDGVEPATSADVEGGGEKSADAPPSVDPKKVELTFANLVDVQGLQKGITLMRRDPVIAICGMLQSLFEGSMYIFVFMWTPALTPALALPHVFPLGYSWVSRLRAWVRRGAASSPSTCSHTSLGPAGRPCGTCATLSARQTGRRHR